MFVSLFGKQIIMITITTIPSKVLILLQENALRLNNEYYNELIKISNECIPAFAEMSFEILNLFAINEIKK